MNDKIEITTEELDDLISYTKGLALKIQDLEDIVNDCITGMNIRDNSIDSRHIIGSAVNISKLDVNLDDINDGDTYGKLYVSSLQNGLALLSAAAGDLDDISDGSYGKVLLTNITAGKIVLGECSGYLGDIADGSSYGKVLLTDISAGHILLSACSGNLDDISSGDTYDKVLKASLSAGAILLSQAIGDLDDIGNGTYGKVLTTDISSGHILLSACEGGLDNIDNGVTYGKVAITDISSGHIVLSTCTGNLDDIANGTSYGKVALTSISAGKIVVAGLDSDATNRMFADLTTKNTVEAWRHASDVTMIDGGDVYTNTITATQINVTTLSAISANMGTLTAGSITGGSINGARFYCGGGTDYDFYFEDSAVYMYDFLGGAGAGYRGLAWKYGTHVFADISRSPTITWQRVLAAGGKSITTVALSTHCQINAQDGANSVTLNLYPVGSAVFNLRGSGTLQFPSLTSAPTAHAGDLTFNSSSNWMSSYTNQWEHFQTTSGW